MNKHFSFESRKFVIGGIVFLTILIYVFRLFDLQIATEKFKINAESNAFFNKVLHPARGAIYDRNGELLVYNQPSYDIIFVPLEVEHLDTLDFCNTLGITLDYFHHRMENVKNKAINPGYSRYTQQVFMSQLSAEETGVFQEKLFKFPGFYVERRTVRRYNYESSAHILGDIGEVSPRELEDDPYYRRGDYIGKQGVERSYEKYLRGVKGVEVLLRDAHGRIQGKYNDGAKDRKPVAGSDLTLSVDINLQLLAEELLQGKMGSVVAIEPETGEILCMVSSPSYDPSLLIVGRDRGKNHRDLQLDPQKPLFNRALMAAYPPASTYKVPQGLVFLQEKIIDVDTSFPCHLGFVVPGLRVGCHSHGSPVPYIHSISTSCNSYYCWGLYKMIDHEKYGSPTKALNVWRDHMVNMGFGYALGVDLPGEKRGLIPNPALYDKIYGANKWGGLRIIHTAIGQGEILLTPVQLANLAATVANEGYFITPHIVKDIKGGELDKKYIEKRYTGIDQQYYKYVKEGMRGAVIGSPFGATCRRANIPGLEICGKTGTAQNRGKDHSVFMGFSPKENPKIAVAVYVEHGGFGATWGVPIGAMIIEKYLNGYIDESRQYLYDYIKDYNLIPDEYKRKKEN